MIRARLDVNPDGSCWCHLAPIPDGGRLSIVRVLLAHGWMVCTPFAGRAWWPGDHVYAIRQQQTTEGTRDLVESCLVMQDELLDHGVELVEFGRRLELLAGSYIPRPGRPG